MTILHGDCREVMATMETASVDAVVTDPPYGLSFMGKGWDHGVPGVEFWIEALRVLKPGGHLLAFGGTRTFHRLTCAIEDAGFEIRDCLSWLYGSGFPKSLNVGDGRGTAIKPAWEPIILARKPLAGTVVANVLAHGTGALNVDACRIGTEGGGGQCPGGDLCACDTSGRAFGKTKHPPRLDGPIGRWPANVVLDEEAAALLDEQSGIQKDSVITPYTEKSVSPSSFNFNGRHKPAFNYGGEGGASRFFYTAKACGSDRTECGAVKNTHPTVKPVDLMRWLCRLVTPPGGLILDPFCGSGSTGVAAIAEGFRFIGIEKEPEYAEIAKRRIANVAPLLAEIAS